MLERSLLKSEMAKVMILSGNKGLSVSQIAIEVKRRKRMWGNNPPTTPENTISNYLTTEKNKGKLKYMVFHEAHFGAYQVNPDMVDKISYHKKSL